MCLRFASSGGVRSCKAAMACASSVQAQPAQVCTEEGLLCLSRAVMSLSACSLSKFDLNPPTLKMLQGVIISVWPFASLLCLLRPFGCSSLDVFYLSGTFRVPLFALQLIHSFFFLIHSTFEVLHHYSSQEEKCLESIFFQLPS